MADDRNSFEERPQSWHRLYENDGATTLKQGHLVLSKVVFKHGAVVNTNGIAAGAFGYYDSHPGRVYQVKAAQHNFVGAVKCDPVYQEPGHGPLLQTATDDSWIVGEIYENQGSNTYIVYQTTIPVAAAEEET